MSDQTNSKILYLEELKEKVNQLKQSGKIVVQTHGVFDLIHPGVIQHLNEAKKQGDVLIVSIIKDKDVRRGPGRPIFPELMRAENVASLSQIDYVCIVDDETPFESVKQIDPSIFAKGKSYSERFKDLHKELFEEEKEFHFGKSKIYETQGFAFSSTSIINKFLELFPDETRDFIKNFAEKYSFEKISELLDQLKDLKVLLIGDGIIDEYHYCVPMGKSAKAHLVVNQYLSDEVFAGGAFAIANHMAGICNEINMVTLLGTEDSREEFVRENLRPNVTPNFFYREDGPSIIKKRYVNQYLNQKVFEINYLNNSYVNSDVEASVIKYLENEIEKYDLVLVSDFGHGFITNDMIKVIESKSKMYAVNTQTNAANSGYNMITKYHNPNFVCLDQPEIRYAAQDRFSDIEIVIKKIAQKINCGYIITTLGKKGSIGLTKDNQMNRTPIFSTKVVDTVGAGDAFFAFTAPCVAKGMPLDFVSFIGNAVGALAVQITCNKRPVEKYELLEFINAIIKQGN